MPTEFTDTVLRLHVRPNDLDSLGHVNNAAAMEYLETGRWDWLVRNGLSRGTVIVPVVIRAELDYRKELVPPEVSVRTRLGTQVGLPDDDETAYRIVFFQSILRDDPWCGADPAVEARISIAFIDSGTRMLRTVREFLAENLAENAAIETKSGDTR